MVIQILVNRAKLFSLSRERVWLFAMVLVLATIFAYRPRGTAVSFGTTISM